MPSKNFQGIETQAKTRLLLALWDLGGAKQEVKKGELTKRIVTKSKKVADYQSIFKELEEKGAIAISKKGYSLVSPVGLEVLGEGLKSSDFRFEGAIVGTWTANALLKWIGEINGAVAATASTNGVKSGIKSYDEFKQVALEVYDQLNRDYNLNDLVPIYRIRREVGDRVSRSDFNEWLLEIQENDVFQLMAGEMPDITPDKREDSITIPGGGLRYYAKRLS
ncbi:hypothetical protein SAMD00079811_24810 [Scytonema sp. HK-05]|uniref:hypothetical protein n=1 Tax=Scytonema sp. HK-05 TaxID=1137095 RepID=UPI00093699B0|nr:hypothetical protein [Scytonema sp. HK-05]OKH44495.1 hypothetical protein NIES2130_37895 [Scytonema sp. HK-05]BAY44879.1 hypothetical protein SAMD00079811_24810 [Scytonema sp. HK-05]